MKDRRSVPPVLLVLLTGLFTTAGTGSAEARGATSPSWRPHVAAARHYANRRAGDVAFAAVDERGRVYGSRMASTAPSASVVKVMLMVAYLRQHGGRRLSVDDRALLAPMIRRSDNVTATAVRDIVGRRRIERLAHVAAMRDFRYHEIWGMCRISPRDQARFMYRLESYIPREHRSYAKHLLSRVVAEQRWGIAKVAPPGWRLFFKGGWGSGTGLVDHQIALLTRRHRRVSLAVLTENAPDHEYGKRTLRGVFARLLGGLEAVTGGTQPR